MRRSEGVDRSEVARVWTTAAPELRLGLPTSLATSRRSFIMLAVLVCMMSAMLVATSLLFISQSEAAGASGSADTAQTRALLWSGVQAVMGRLAEQRDRLLAGDLPSVDSQFIIYETESRAGVVRLLPVNEAGAIMIPEASKLDFNHVDAAALARTGMVDRSAADALVAWRDRLGRPVQSIAELLSAPGMSTTVLYGSLDALLASDVSQPLSDGRPAESSGGALRGLADVLTVFAVEPAVQYTGRRRISLNQPWSEELGRAIEERFGAEAAALLKQIFEKGAKFESDSSLVKEMRANRTPPDDWPVVLDAFTTEKGAYHFGRLNINAAPREALLALPGISEEQAAQIINTRQELSPLERGTITWPLSNQIITPQAFEEIAGLLTTRSWTFRIRLAAGEVDADEPDGPLTNPLVQELVIDLAGPRPRIAYLRDITLLHDAAMIALDATRRSEAGDGGALEDVPPSSQPELRGEADDASSGARSSRGPASRPGRAPIAGGSATTMTTDPNERSGVDVDEGSAEPAGPGRIGRWTSGGS